MIVRHDVLRLLQNVAYVRLKECTPGAPLTYFNDGRLRVIFLGLKFWPKVVFWGLLKTPGFFGSQRKNRGIFLGCEKRTKGFFGYAKKVVMFLGRRILKL